jgi:hypothetical protein
VICAVNGNASAALTVDPAWLSDICPTSIKACRIVVKGLTTEEPRGATMTVVGDRFVSTSTQEKSPSLSKIGP